jgi:hypothetical protein
LARNDEEEEIEETQISRGDDRYHSLFDDMPYYDANEINASSFHVDTTDDLSEEHLKKKKKKKKKQPKRKSVDVIEEEEEIEKNSKKRSTKKNEGTRSKRKRDATEEEEENEKVPKKKKKSTKKDEEKEKSSPKKRKRVDEEKENDQQASSKNSNKKMKKPLPTGYLRRCIVCNEEKDISEFWKTGNVRNWCYGCHLSSCKERNKIKRHQEAEARKKKVCSIEYIDYLSPN